MYHDMGVSIHGGTPVHHPLKYDVPWSKPSSYWGTTMTMETPIFRDSWWSSWCIMHPLFVFANLAWVKATLGADWERTLAAGVVGSHGIVLDYYTLTDWGLFWHFLVHGKPYQHQPTSAIPWTNHFIMFRDAQQVYLWRCEIKNGFQKLCYV